MLRNQPQCSFLWGFWSGRRHCPWFNRSIKRSFVRILELVNIFRQLPCYSAVESFLVQGFLLWPLLKPSCARTTLVRFALLNGASRWTRSFPICCAVPRALGEFDGVIWSQIWNFPQNRLSPRVIFGHTTQFVTSPSIKATDPSAPPFFDFLLSGLGLVVVTTGGCQNPHDGFLQFL